MKACNVLLSAPLQRLKDEHMHLRAAMDHFYEITEEIEYESGPGVVQLFAKLHEQISAFNVELKAHSKREEEGLFHLMTLRLGENDKTIQVMEEEHEKAEQHLQDFLTEAARAGVAIDEYDAQTITVYAVQAYATLTQHFAKEEKALFPLAERILSVNDMAELEKISG
ncbi:hemerythrin domain-containing protein [Bacillus dakarensis]|uniref:hemerythrin domain-containing protein n=1 Tax=Robertmurraya dakarensis TaxID=1926278 RepID=UPI0009821378|nr:hemerythrin domain-containing protein [Bacillus dakarensis]